MKFCLDRPGFRAEAFPTWVCSSDEVKLFVLTDRGQHCVSDPTTLSKAIDLAFFLMREYEADTSAPKFNMGTDWDAFLDRMQREWIWSRTERDSFACTLVRYGWSEHPGFEAARGKTCGELVGC